MGLHVNRGPFGVNRLGGDLCPPLLRWEPQTQGCLFLVFASTQNRGGAPHKGARLNLVSGKGDLLSHKGRIGEKAVSGFVADGRKMIVPRDLTWLETWQHKLHSSTTQPATGTHAS